MLVWMVEWLIIWLFGYKGGCMVGCIADGGVARIELWLYGLLNGL